jgi:hypothetical protein
MGQRHQKHADADALPRFAAALVPAPGFPT